MIIKETSISGVYLIEQERNFDKRGFFSRTFCINEFSKIMTNFRVDQISTSFNTHKGTLRGMHYQELTHPETKIVRCTRGLIYDVILDLRKTSQTYLKWLTFNLSSENGLAVLVPPGCAHGFQTLENNTEVLYTNSGIYVQAASKTVRWNDPSFDIKWPSCAHRTMSDKDKGEADFER